MRWGIVTRTLVLVGFCVGGLLLVGCDWLRPQPGVDFSFTPSSGEKPLLVDFAPVVENTAAGYLWDFGDGPTSTEEAPSHIYYAAGTYSVTLTVQFADGKSSAAHKRDCVVVTPGPMFDEGTGHIYWLNRSSGTIGRGSPDGAEPKQALVSGISDGDSIAVGSTKIFWTSTSRVEQAALDGTGRKTIVSNLQMAAGIGVDLSKNKVYWTVLPSSSITSTQWGGGIYRANLDGTGRETLKSYPAGSAPFAWQLAVDPAGGKVYWFYRSYDLVLPLGRTQPAAYSCNKTIQAASVSSFSPASVIASVCPGTQLAPSVGLPEAARYLYWTDSTAGKVFRCKTDGTGLTTLLSGLAHPKGIVIDAKNNALYWSDDAGIHRANQDGTNARILYAGVTADSIALGP